jgi:CPA1 family monovalent cation:H+ antiporter
METATTAMLLLLAVVLSGFAGRLVRGVPLPLMQIGFGAALSWVRGSAPPLEPEFFLFFFIPPLLFADARRYPKREGVRLWRAITTLALGLVVFTVVGAGFFIDWLVPSIPLPVAFALAAVLSPTDPVAVSAITAKTPIPRTMMHLLEGEALLNDATGLVCLRFAVAAMMTGSFSVVHATGAFLVVALGGTLIGAGLPWIIGAIQRVLIGKGGEDPATQVLVTLLQPFAAYLAAEHLNLSGILAAVAAGLMLPYVELQGSGSAETRLFGNAVWRMVQFALNGAIFVLLGEQIPGIIAGRDVVVAEAQVQGLWDLAWYVGAIALVLTVLRFVWIGVSARVAGLRAQRRGESSTRPQIRMVAAMAVAGVRGAITLVGVLTLPLTLPSGAPFPARATAIFLACGVILVSLLVASILLPYLLPDLDVTAPTSREDDERTRSHLADIAVRRIEAAQGIQTHVAADIFAEAAARIIAVYRQLQHPHSLDLDLDEQERARKLIEVERELRLLGLRAEREELLRLRRLRELSDESTTRFMRELDLLESQLTHGPAH